MHTCVCVCMLVHDYNVWRSDRLACFSTNFRGTLDVFSRGPIRVSTHFVLLRANQVESERARASH